MNRERAKELLPIIEHYANGGKVEMYYEEEGVWIFCHEPLFAEDIEYRIPQVPDKFTNWDILPPEYRWIMRDEYDFAFAFCERPEISSDGSTITGGGWHMKIGELTCYERGTVDWRNSLIVRPE